jgi:predicted amidohydrolase YtcJ
MRSATLVILNAHAITLDAKQPEAEAIAIHEGKIIAVGSNAEIGKRIDKETKLINAENRVVVPGLVDCHIHMTGFGQFSQNLELRDAGSIKELQQRLRKYSEGSKVKRWILGGRWDHERFSEKRYPTRWDLDAAVADRPVFLTRVCGHIGVANSKALQLANITEKTAVDGGRIDLDRKTGEPNGVLRENTMGLVWKAIPKPTMNELEETCILACQKAVEAGLTCVHWMIGFAEEIRILQKLHSEGKLPLRVYLGIPIEFLNNLTRLGLQTGFGDDMVKIGFVKILADGSLGGHTASLKEPYADNPETCGVMLYTQEELNRLISKAHEASLQVAVHAIGDYAIEVVLRAYESALKEHPSKDRRHRIEHCSVLNPKLIKRMKRLGLIASVQPHFVVSDFWVVGRVGNSRARWVYPFKTLVRQGLMIVSGSDCPVEPINPILGIWAAVAGRNFAEESLTIEEALKTYTLNAAYASFDEDKRGKIEVGKLADLTILSGDLLSVSPDDIRKNTVEMTIVNGEVVYAKKHSRNAS